MKKNEFIFQHYTLTKFLCWTLTFLANKEEKIAQKIREKVEKNSAYVIYEWPLRQALNSTPLFHAKRNRVELVSDFAPGNVPDIVSSLQIHPQGWVAVSRNVSSDQSTGKSLSEALIFAENGENMLCTEIDFDIQNNFCTLHVLPIFCKNKSF